MKNTQNYKFCLVLLKKILQLWPKEKPSQEDREVFFHEINEFVSTGFVNNNIFFAINGFYKVSHVEVVSDGLAIYFYDNSGERYRVIFCEENGSYRILSLLFECPLCFGEGINQGRICELCGGKGWGVN